MNKTNILLALLGVSVIATTQAEKPHQHGVANLNIAISKQELVIELLTPSYNVVGFGYIPKTDQQKQKLSKALSLLNKPNSLFEIPKQAQCSLKKLKISNPMESKKADEKDHKHEEQHTKKVDDQNHEEHDTIDSSDSHDEDKHEEHKTHSEFTIQYSYHCQQAAQLTGLKSTGLFEHFPSFTTLKVQWVNDQQQSATTMTKKEVSVSFKP